MAEQDRPEAGWYPEPGNPGQERLWDGERWGGWIRPSDPHRQEANPAGWRPDPSRPGFERLWSGEAWTGLIRPLAADAAAPAANHPVAATTAGGTRHFDANPPQRLQGAGDWVRFLLVLLALTQVGVVISRQVYIGYDSDRLNGRSPSLNSIEAAVHGVAVTTGIEALITLCTTIAFIVWFHRAYRNLVRGGITDIRYGTGWAIGGWFIPILSWFRQKAIANDIWKGSAALAVGRREGWRQAGIPYTLNWWWGLWIAGGLVALVGRRIGKAEEAFATSEALRDERTLLYVGQVGTLLLIAASVVLYFVVRDVSRMQDGVFHPGADHDGAAVAGLEVATASVPPAGGGLGVTAAPFPPPAQPAAPAAMKTCPDCAEDVKAAARVCRYCGYRFDSPAA